MYIYTYHSFFIRVLIYLISQNKLWVYNLYSIWKNTKTNCIFLFKFKSESFQLKKNEYFMSHELFVGACSYYFVCFKSIFFEYILSILYCAFSFLCVILYLSSKMKLWKKYNYCIIRMKWAKIFIGAQYYCIRKRILYFQIVQECLSF